MLPGRTYGIEDVLRVAWQRKWFIVLPLVVIATATVLYARSLPDVYRSETTILVVPQRVPESYVRSTVTSRIEDRLQSLRQQILSRARLEPVILEFDLYAEQRRTALMENVVGRMRAAVDVQIVRGDAFSISYKSTDPRAAMKVTERLATLFIEENLREREGLAEGTSEFLETQLVQARQRLEEHERKLAEYRRVHAGELPSQLESNLQILNSLNVQAQATASEIDRDRDRAFALDRTVAEAADVTAPTSAAAVTWTEAPGAPAPQSARLLAAEGSLQTIETALQEARGTLTKLRTRVTAEHPDVAPAERAVADLERKLAAQRQVVEFERRLATSDAPMAPSDNGVAQQAVVAQRSAADAARQRRLEELRRDKDNLERQIARKQEEEARLRALIATYQTRIEATPTRESELIALTRDYETLQQIYTTLLAKKEDSAVAANLERRQISEQFRVLDPARVPQQPFSPNRMRINILGVFLGLAFGVGLAALLEYRDATLKTEEDVRTCLALPVLAAIPMLGGRAEAQRHRMAAVGAFRLVRWLLRGDAQ